MFSLKTFYKSKEWNSFREQILLERVNDSGAVVCEHCHNVIVNRYDCIAHHKVELTEANVNDYGISLNKDNIMLIHFRCHNEIHQRFGNNKREVYIVYGSPCSGKLNWVKNNMNVGDLVIDIDSIWEALSLCDRYVKPNKLKANVFGVKDYLIEQVKMRMGMWSTCFIVGSFPLKMDRERLADRLNAKLIYIEASKEDCISKAINEDYVKYIEEWFENFTE